MAKQLTPSQIAAVWDLKDHPHRVIVERTGVGLGSVSRILASPRPVPPVTAPAPPLPATPEAIPEGTPVEILAQWRDLAAAEGLKSQSQGDVRGFASMARLVATLSEAIRKVTPDPVVDPSQDVDMLRLGADVERRFLQLITEACE